MTHADWPVTFFDEEYLRIYQPLLTAERTRDEADFIVEALKLPPAARVLDLACGHGRHAVELSRRGFRVTGVDLSEPYLQLAAAEARRAGVQVEWLARDMRELEFDRTFDGAYSFFTSFGYYGDRENEAVIERLARAVKPGARLLLDLVNRDSLLASPPGRTWNQRDDGALLMEERSLDPVTSRVRVRQTLIDPESGPRPVKEYDVRLYTCAELTAMFDRHGLERLEVWGGADRSSYVPDSPRLVLLAERRAG
ncbi:MAG TPA: methyltransferase domain-containing protein [Candidatus Sulfotelmatobacter sp.]|nr:methyltransferase domain-containing protein [Candidatus Sulfotelmatobacter sp.]